MTNTAPRQLAFATLADVSGATLRVCDRVNKGVWFECLVAGVRTQVRLAMKSGRVVAVRAA